MVPSLPRPPPLLLCGQSIRKTDRLQVVREQPGQSHEEDREPSCRESLQDSTECPDHAEWAEAQKEQPHPSRLHPKLPPA